MNTMSKYISFNDPISQYLRDLYLFLPRIWQPSERFEDYCSWRGDGGEWYVSRRCAIWIRLKATLCLILNRWANDTSSHLEYDNMFTLARYDTSSYWGEYGTEYSWSEFYVAIKGFWIQEGSAST